MAVSLPDARQLSDEVLEALRLRGLRGGELGYTEEEIADLLGVARETVSRWWSAYAQGGLEARPQDRTGRPPGAGRTLSDQQADLIRQRINEPSPDELGIAAPLWTRQAVRDLILTELGIARPVRTGGEYLQRWGYTAKRPRRQDRPQDPEEVRQWLEETYPAIAPPAKEQDAEIHGCAEVGVAADRHPACGYAPQGEPATRTVPDKPIRINPIETIPNEGTVRCMTSKQTMTVALFRVFLGRLLGSTTKKLFLIVDRLPAHKGAAVESGLATHRDRIELFYLPRPAPELNPPAYLHHDWKKNVNAEGLPDNQTVLRSRLQHVMGKLLHLPQRVRNYFKHPCVLYAIGS